MCDAPHIHTEPTSYPYAGKRTFVDECTIGQFTGIYDKKGSPIYEGDIIGCDNPKIKHLIFYNEKQGRFMAALDGKTEDNFFGVCGLDDARWISSKEVIGNIYDNPELIYNDNNDLSYL